MTSAPNADGTPHVQQNALAKALSLAKVDIGFAENPVNSIGSMLRRGSCDTALLQTVRAIKTILDGPARSSFVEALVTDARNATKQRFAHGIVRSLWGVTPIINLIPCATADKLLGNMAETVVNTAYHVTRQFDLVLKNQRDWIMREHPYEFEAYTWLVFTWALIEFDVFFLFNDTGILSPAGGYGSKRFGINREEMRLLRASDKRLYTMTYGADNRVRGQTLASGKFNFCMDCPEVSKFCICDDNDAKQMFAEISSHATAMLACGLSLDYVPSPWNIDHLVIDTEKIVPIYGAPVVGRALKLVHAPNHPHFKGTRYLTEVVERLQSEGAAIELRLLSGVSNEGVMDAVRDCDLVVDQLIGGSFGYFAVEALACGKPVMCYIRQPTRVIAPSELPIINVNPDTLYDSLKGLLQNPHQLIEVGARSRKYVEKYHSITAFSERLRLLYLGTGNFPQNVVNRLAPNQLEDLERLRWEGTSAALAATRIDVVTLRNQLNATERELKDSLQREIRLEHANKALESRITHLEKDNTALNAHVASREVELANALRATQSKATDLDDRIQYLTKVAAILEERNTETNRSIDEQIAQNFDILSSKIALLDRRTSGLLADLREGRIRQRVRHKATQLAQKIQAVTANLRNYKATAKRRLRNLVRHGLISCFALCARLQPILIVVARALTRWRMRFGTPRTLWGVTPIITLSYLVRCDRLLGLRSESLVYAIYHTWADFTIKLNRWHSIFVSKYPNWYPHFTWAVFAYALLRYDVFHLFCDRGFLLPRGGTFGINPQEMETLKLAGKRFYTYTYGADVRTAAATHAALPHYSVCKECPKPGLYCICDDAKGTENMLAIAKHANAMLAMGDMTLYVPGFRDLSFWPIDTERIKYVGVRIDRSRPLRVAHAPNHAHFKGTRYLVAAIDRLREEGMAIELISVTGVSNDEVLRLFATADIVADQFISGMYGYTALEGMGRGKPVMCYVSQPAWLIAYDECPIINCHPETIYDTLKQLINSPAILEEIGMQSRLYIEKHHSFNAVAARLGRLYIETGQFPARVRNKIQKRVDILEQLLTHLPSATVPVVCRGKSACDTVANQRAHLRTISDPLHIPATS